MALADPVVVGRAWMLTHPRVRELAGEDGVADTLPGPGRAVVLTAAGGSLGDYPGESLPRLQVACWDAPDGDGTDALALAEAVLELVDATPWEGGGVVVAMAWAEGHPFESPDETTGRRRWLLSLRLHLYGAS